MTTKTTRGGARPGAGRKALGPDTKKVTISARLLPELAENLRARARAQGITPTELLTVILQRELN